MSYRPDETDGGLRRCDAVLWHEGEMVSGRFQALVRRDAVMELVEREEAERFPDFLSAPMAIPSPVPMVLGGGCRYCGHAEPGHYGWCDGRSLLGDEDGGGLVMAWQPMPATESQEAVREEVFRGMIGYLFGGGIHPAEVLPRAYSLVRSARPEWLARIDAKVLRTMWQGDHGAARDGIVALWWARQKGDALPKKGGAARLERVLRDTVDAGLLKLSGLPAARLGELVRTPERHAALVTLVEFLTGDGKRLDPVMLGRNVYGIGKALVEDELDGASLQVLAELSGETRAIWSLRIIDLRERLEAAGIRIVRFQFQKSSEACESYREAQLEVWRNGGRRREDRGARSEERGMVKLGMN